MPDTDRDFINSLAKGLNLLMTFSKDRPRLTLSEVARANQMNLPTARRYLHTLAKLGFVLKDEHTQTFQLTPKVLRLGSWVIEEMGLRSRLLPHMSAITRAHDVTTHCAILEGHEVVTVERLRSSDVVNLDLTAGSRLPAYSTSLGKAILAWLEPAEQEAIIARLDFKPLTPRTITDARSFRRELKRTRRRGYAVADEELTVGLKTLAVPVFDRQGKVEASVGVSYPIIRAREDGLEETLVRRLLELSRRASAAPPPESGAAAD